MVKELIKSCEELKQIAVALASEIANPAENIVSRYMKITYDTVSFVNGKKQMQKNAATQVNLEHMDAGIYTKADIDDLFTHNIAEVLLSRTLQKARFQLSSKGVRLPTEQKIYYVEIPTGIEMYDQEFAEFTKRHPNTRIIRDLSVQQRVIVNSQKGIVIQSIPFFTISYLHGYEPLSTQRVLAAVCSSEEDIARFPELIQWLPDPTVEKRIKRAGSFSEAFHTLHALSPLRYGSLEEAGLPLAGLYDPIVLTGVPAHEVFGHHFEEPMHFLEFAEVATFKKGQDIKNQDIVIMDNPYSTIQNFHVAGFTFVDAYGRKREVRTHVKEGKCLEFLGGEYANPDNLQAYLHYNNAENNTFVGNTCQYIDGRFPQPRMSCTFLDGKTEKVDLEGKLLIVPHAGYTRNQDKTFVLDAKECYVIKDGEPRRVAPVKVTGSINHALENLTLLEDWNYDPGMCGKPAFRWEDGSTATVPVSQITRSQMWRDQQVFPLPMPDNYLKRMIKE